MQVKYCAIYARQSVDRMDSISIESQVEFCICETGGSPYTVFKDKGYSGKSIDRPQFQEMLRLIRQGEIKKVICYKLDRISRSILDFTTMMDEFQRFGVEFVSCTEKFDTSTPMGRAMLSICIVFAQLERETIQQRVTDAYRSRSRKGYYMGGKIPYGFRLEPYTIDGKQTARYTVHREEAEIIQRIYAHYALPHISYGDVIRQLGNNGSERTWNRSQIAGILKNPIYVRADLRIYDFFKSQGAVVHDPPSDFRGIRGCYLYSEKNAARKSLSLAGQHVVIAPHEGIVSADLWLRAREKCINNPQVAKPVKAVNTWLAGKIKCADCGYALIIRKAQTKVGRYFICSRHLQASHLCSGVGGLIADEVEEAIFTAICTRLEEFAVLTDPMAIKPLQTPEMSELSLQLVQIQEEAEKLIAKIASADPIVTEYISKRIRELDQQKRAVGQRLETLQSDMQTKFQAHFITHCMQYWERLTCEDRMAVVDTLISVIRADQNRIVIEWKI